MGIGKYKFVLNTFLPDKTALPDVILIGVQKAATTSLYHYLVQHPSIKGSRYKEVHFFDRNKKYRRGLTWYKRQFPWRGDADILLEATPNYIYRPKVPERISRINKEIKFIVSLRDPLSRALSAWNMYRVKQNEESFNALTKVLDANNKGFRMHDFLCKGPLPSFEEFTRLELQWMEENSGIVEPSIIRQGFYEERLRYWLKFFPRERFYFVKMDDLQYPKVLETLQAIEKFMGIPVGFDWDSVSYQRRNVRKLELHTRKFDQKVLERLAELYRRKNRNLEKLTGLSFNWL